MLWCAGAFGAPLRGENQENTIREVSPNRVVVRGRRLDQVRMEHPGAGLRFHPNGGSQDDLETHFRRSAALTVLPHDKPSPFGFSIPRIRGQDARFSQVFIDDLALSDPWSSLPLAEELDLPAFSSVEVTSGSAPFDLPAIASRGALRFGLFEEDEVDQSHRARQDFPLTGGIQKFAGSRITDPKGQATWVGSASSDFRLYTRQSNSRGNYRYYDDGGTPLNHFDDHVVRRENNDRASRFFLPAAQWRGDDFNIRAFGLWNEADQGLAPLRSKSVGGGGAFARQKTWIRAGRIALNRHMPGQNELRIAVGAVSDVRSVNDPAADVLVSARKDHREILTRNGSLEWKGRYFNDRLICKLAGIVERSDVKVRGGPGVNVFDQMEDAPDNLTFRRDSGRGVFAVQQADASILPGMVEAKVDGGVARDSSSDGTGNGRSTAKPSGLSFMWGALPGSVMRPYMQVAREIRPAGLMETFGDGALIHRSYGLVAERIDHLEVGIDHVFLDDSLETHFAAFGDRREHAIVIVPASVSSYRAVNLSDPSLIAGVEVDLSWSFPLLSRGESRLGVSWVFFHSDSGGGAGTSGERLVVPGVPRDEGAISFLLPLWRRPWRGVAGRWTARRRGEVYRDVANDIALPPWWSHDAAVDFRWQQNSAFTAGIRLVGGIAVTNIFDQMAVTWQTSSGGSGKTGYSDLWGVPLPGRAVTASLAVEF
jgi:hypothetical protein